MADWSHLNTVRKDQAADDPTADCASPYESAGTGSIFAEEQEKS